MEEPKTEKKEPILPRAKRDPNKLTKKEALFCKYYVTNWNTKKAAVLAGYSEHSAYSIGHENLRKPRINRRIQAILAKRMKPLEITHARILEEVSNIAFSKVPDVAQIKNGRLNLVDTDEIPPDAIGAIRGYSESITRDGGSQSVNFYDKMEALKLLVKLTGMEGADSKTTTLEEALLEAIQKKVESK